jgi:hypothetical protein
MVGKSTRRLLLTSAMNSGVFGCRYASLFTAGVAAKEDSKWAFITQPLRLGGTANSGH